VKTCYLLALLLLWCVADAAAQSTIFVVRHAEKAAAPRPDEKDPELSPAGRARAAALAVMLKDAQITSVFATEFKRTQQTAEPLARALQINVTTVPASDTAALVAQVKEADGNALIVGHSNTVPAILQALGSQQPVTIGDDEYDNLFVLTSGTPERVLRLHIPPGEPDRATVKATDAVSGD
jgi:broad specificity phosphatase PhoE